MNEFDLVSINNDMVTAGINMKITINGIEYFIYGETDYESCSPLIGCRFFDLHNIIILQNCTPYYYYFLGKQCYAGLELYELFENINFKVSKDQSRRKPKSWEDFKISFDSKERSCFVLNNISEVAEKTQSLKNSKEVSKKEVELLEIINEIESGIIISIETHKDLHSPSSFNMTESFLYDYTFIRSFMITGSNYLTNLVPTSFGKYLKGFLFQTPESQFIILSRVKTFDEGVENVNISIVGKTREEINLENYRRKTILQLAH